MALASLRQLCATWAPWYDDNGGAGCFENCGCFEPVDPNPHGFPWCYQIERPTCYIAGANPALRQPCPGWERSFDDNGGAGCVANGCCFQSGPDGYPHCFASSPLSDIPWGQGNGSHGRRIMSRFQLRADSEGATSIAMDYNCRDAANELGMSTLQMTGYVGTGDGDWNCLADFGGGQRIPRDGTTCAPNDALTAYKYGMRGTLVPLCFFCLLR